MAQQTMDHPAQASTPLDELQRAFASACADAFTQQTGSPFRAIILPWDHVTYHDFSLSLADPTFLIVFTSNLFQGEMALEVQPALAYLLLEHLLGGSDSEPFIPPRKFTEIEQRLLLPIFNDLLERLAQLWPDQILRCRSGRTTKAHFTLKSVEHNPKCIRIVPDDERVTTVPIEFCTGVTVRNPQSHAQLTLCLPTPAVATLREASTAARSYADPIEFRAVLAEARITEEELNALQLGDVITTEAAAGSLIKLIPVDPSPTRPLAGELVKLRGHKAIRIRR